MVCRDTDSTSTLCPRDLIVSAICNRVSGAILSWHISMKIYIYVYIYSSSSLYVVWKKKETVLIYNIEAIFSSSESLLTMREL